jgi:hypothetical protein
VRLRVKIMTNRRKKNKILKSATINCDTFLATLNSKLSPTSQNTDRGIFCSDGMFVGQNIQGVSRGINILGGGSKDYYE